MLQLQAAQRREEENAKLTQCENVTLACASPGVPEKQRWKEAAPAVGYFSFPRGGDIKCCSQARGSLWELRVIHPQPPFWCLDIIQGKILHHKL